MRAVAALAVFVFVVFIIIGFSMLVNCAVSDVAKRGLRKCAVSRARSRERACRNVPWTYYSRMNPHTGNYHVGIERICKDRVVSSIQIGEPIPSNDETARLDREGEAISRACQCNMDKSH